MAITAIVQTDEAKGIVQVPTPRSAGDVHFYQFILDLSATAIDTSDNIVEIGRLPAFCKVVDAEISTVGTWTSNTADVGYLSGTAGDADLTRTLGSELIFDDADLTTTTEMTPVKRRAATAVAYDRGIGITLALDSTAVASKIVQLDLWYIQS